MELLRGDGAIGRIQYKINDQEWRDLNHENYFDSGQLVPGEYNFLFREAYGDKSNGHAVSTGVLSFYDHSTYDYRYESNGPSIGDFMSLNCLYNLPSCSYHSADTNFNGLIEGSELFRAQELKNAGSYGCDASEIDGYTPNKTGGGCFPHHLDRNGSFQIEDAEFSRMTELMSFESGYGVSMVTDDYFGSFSRNGKVRCRFTLSELENGSRKCEIYVDRKLVTTCTGITSCDSEIILIPDGVVLEVKLISSQTCPKVLGEFVEYSPAPRGGI